MKERVTSEELSESHTSLLVMEVSMVMKGGMGSFGRMNDMKVASSIGIPFLSKMTAASSIISFFRLLPPVVSRSKTTYTTFSQSIVEGSWTVVMAKGAGGGARTTRFGFPAGFTAPEAAVARGNTGQFRLS